MSLRENSAGSEEGAHSDVAVEGVGEAGLAAEGWKGRVTPHPTPTASDEKQGKVGPRDIEGREGRAPQPHT